MRSVRISGCGVASVNGIFTAQPASIVPVGFALVCRKQRWGPEEMWEQLTDLKRPWYLKENNAYIYFNRGDGKWWIDAPEGNGLYIAKEQKDEDKNLPPQRGWDLLGNEYAPLPTIEIIVAEDKEM